MQTTSSTQQFERIPTEVFPSSAEACARLAKEIRALIDEKTERGESPVLGLATGSTPVPLYRELIRLHKEEGLSFKNVVTFNLDEYHGLTRDHPESYYRFMHDQLFDHIDIEPSNVHVPDGTVAIDQVFEYCQQYEDQIAEAGGLDIQILGIGRTGHIGFNEPGSSRDSRTRMIALDRVTRQDAAADFLGEKNVPRLAITMGVGTILGARKLVLFAWGENKADIVASAVEGPETDQISASFLQGHDSARFVINQSAAKSLTRFQLPWLVGHVDWDDRSTRHAVTWLSREASKSLLKLTDEDYNEHRLADLLTRHDAAYQLNINVFNKTQHTITGWPGGKPNADDSHRPERQSPASKRVLVFSPEPQEEIISMGGTLERLVDQNHGVEVIYQTSGDLRVSDGEAYNFARVLAETAERMDWPDQLTYAENIISQLETKGEFGQPTEELRHLKRLIRRGEARDACQALRVTAEHVHFLDLPFYSKGRYRRFEISEEDIAAVAEVIRLHQPHQIFATGHVADPSSHQAICFETVRLALASMKDEAWLESCYVWLYRGQQRPLDAHEIDMAVPMSPDQLDQKIAAIQKFQSHNQSDDLRGERNRTTADAYNHLGMAEYEAIEAFERWKPAPR